MMILRALARAQFLSVLILLTSVTGSFSQTTIFRHPKAGDIFRDYSRVMQSYQDWAVIDPNTQRSDAKTYLPNAVLPLTISDLQGAVRAEMIIDYHQTHVGTVGAKARVNGKAWIPIPMIQTTPSAAECFCYTANVVIDVPLSDLVQGTNYLEGTNTGQTCYTFDWGQWGWFAVTVRVYYGSGKTHPTGSIASPSAGATIGENPVVSINASGGSGVGRVDVIAFYDGYDIDGDGIYADWQYNYHRRITENFLDIHDHVGSTTTSPYQVRWNTDLVPDQAAGAVKLRAHIRDNTGLTYVTNEVSGINFVRSGSAVRMYRASNVPTRFQMRNVDPVKSCNIVIPSGNDLSKATSVKVLVKTWNGVNTQATSGQIGYTKLNSLQFPLYGASMHWSYDVRDVPVSTVFNGTNVFTLYSNSIGYGMRVEWPGPAIVVRYGGSITPPPDPVPTKLSFGVQPTSTTPGCDHHAGRDGADRGCQRQPGDGRYPLGDGCSRIEPGRQHTVRDKDGVGGGRGCDVQHAVAEQRRERLHADGERHRPDGRDIVGVQHHDDATSSDGQHRCQRRV